jgi:transcriptional regulator with XRE-family HTH domain
MAVAEMPKKERFKELRDAAGLTLAQLAVAAGLSPSVVFELETGSATNPRFKTLHSIARVLGVSVHKLITALELDAEASAEPKKTPRKRRK